MKKVTVIGAGVVGGMIARRLAEYDIKLIITEKEGDVAMGQSKANSGIVHAGYDPMPGSLKALLNVRGSKIMEETCKDLGVSYTRNGALIVAFSSEDEKTLQFLLERGRQNGVEGLEVIDGSKARNIEKNLSKRVTAALYAPTSAVVCPYGLTLAAIGNAMDNGAELLLNFNVSDIEKCDGRGFVIKAEDGRSLETDYIINCAGVYSDRIASMVGDSSFSITPRAGEYMLLDKEAGELTQSTVFKVPDAMGKGVLATKTVHGNILLGPTSVDRKSKEDDSVTAEGLAAVRLKEKLFFDNLPFDKVITQFTGVRAHGNKGDFIINSPLDGFINVAGIESPGLTSAPAIAQEVERLLLALGFTADKRRNYNPRRESKIVFSECSREEKDRLIKANPDYGQIVCRCEEITKAEILEAIRTNPPARDIDAIKRRTRSGMGRCQGGFCMSQVLEILADELHLPPEKITKKGGKSTILTGKVKGGEKK